MKNLFVKENDNSLVIAAVAVGAIAAGAIAYLYATKKGYSFRKKLSNVAEGAKDHSTDYLEKKNTKRKRKTTDLHEIEQIVKG
ncbi:YtxH domain-containing protein [Mucilaginibacter sp. PAMB04168]|uniref:YtxH domain-containing protein n=1 Tax=Mucilaginibacter sp. PAMB04168 TaxID=3138567 RepID=UPI0031F6EF60